MGNGYTELPGSISAVYPGSNVSFFDFSDFYFGCSADKNVTQNGEKQTENVPDNCALTLTGYKNQGTRLPGLSVKPDFANTFHYVPKITPNPETQAPAAPMMHIILKNFNGMKTITFNATTKAPYLSAPLIYFDNMSYQVTNVTVS